MPHTVPSTTSAKSNLFDKLIVLPPSPPTSINSTTSQPVLELLQFLRSRRHGRILPAWEKPWNNIRLSVEEYDEFETLLENDKDGLWGYVRDKVRYDWNPRLLTLTIRMPTSTHEDFLQQLEFDIERQRYNIAQSSTGLVAKIAEQISAFRSTDLYFEWKEKRSPDSQWGHRGEDGFPSMIIEISYAQKMKELSYLASEYIIGSRGLTQMVVGIDIEYHGTKEARFMVWRPKLTTKDGESFLTEELTMNETFRDADGAGLPGNFVFRLDDFARPEIFENASEAEKATPITIPYKTMAKWLEDGETRHRNREKKRKYREENGFEYSKQYPEGTKFVRRERTPAEEVAPVDEAKFKEEVIIANQRRSEEDADYDGVGEHDENDGETRRSVRIARR